MKIQARFTVLGGCRACGSDKLEEVLDLGTTPLADRLVDGDKLDAPEPMAPLTVLRCADCTLVQIAETVDPKQLFCEDYPYYSSVSPSLMAHFRGSALALISGRELGADSLVVEAASNDGYMLQNFKEAGIRVLGIDPASGPVAAAREKGIETIEDFFSRDLSRTIRASHGPADVFLANNVLAHVPDLNGFVDGISNILGDAGIAVIEAPYLCDLIAKCEFDTIYHQHLCYFSITALQRLFASHGLYLNRVERTSIHGGSLRLFVEKQPNPDGSTEAMIEDEMKAGLHAPGYYHDFADRVRNLKIALRNKLDEIKGSGKTVAGYGAAAKATTLMSFCGIDADDLPYIVDLNQHKWNRHMGGNHIPILPPERLNENPPDYLLILAWNFADEIIRQQAAFQESGGQFIVPVPELKIV